MNTGGKKIFGTKSTPPSFKKHGEETVKCRHAKKMISASLDDALSPGEKKDFDAHIQDCASCREELEETRDLHRMFASVPRFPAPYGFATRVLANLEEREGSRPRGLLPIRPFFLRAAQVAFALVVMTVGMVSGNLLLTHKAEPLGPTAVQETFFLDHFQTTPPDSMGGIYVTLMRPGNEE
jgi:anti-sigma factor RsiW